MSSRWVYAALIIRLPLHAIPPLAFSCACSLFIPSCTSCSRWRWATWEPSPVLVHSMLVLSSSPHAYFLQEVALSDTGSFAGGAPDSPPGGAGRGGGGGGMERGQYGGNCRVGGRGATTVGYGRGGAKRIWPTGEGGAIWKEGLVLGHVARFEASGKLRPA